MLFFGGEKGSGREESETKERMAEEEKMNVHVVRRWIRSRQSQVNNDQKSSSHSMPMLLMRAQSQTAAENEDVSAPDCGVLTVAKRLDAGGSAVGEVVPLHGWVIGRKGGRYLRRRSRMGVWMEAGAGWKALSEGDLLDHHVARGCAAGGDGCCCYVLWALTGQI